jgi:hypothetical protein
MGIFMSVSAVRDRTLGKVVASICECAARSGIDASVTREKPNGEADAVVASREGWTLVFWPTYFASQAQAISKTLSGSLQTQISYVDVCDGDDWYHYLFGNGDELDRYSSDPGYFTSDLKEKEELRREWRGNPEVIAAQFGVDPAIVRPYLIDWELLPPPPPKGVVRRALRWLGWSSQVDPDELGPMASPDDEYRLGDIWVFVDFWRRVGIPYDSGPGE